MPADRHALAGSVTTLCPNADRYLVPVVPQRGLASGYRSRPSSGIGSHSHA